MTIYWQLIWAYIKIGIFGFGGGYAMLSLVEKAVVGPGWISDRHKFRHVYRVCRARKRQPGTIRHRMGTLRLLPCHTRCGDSKFPTCALQLPFHKAP